ncbi:carbohydrate ABC transporter permease [Actinocatenispora rupis]|uniref:ABC transporter permease n=1 Tax=Actinocatenispora rupis TaxID=519421 RepID=A0A8J3J1V9_9ACTN|nr:carbohydrate ABC transporter permease [Actinocatenispora rupis]GID10570.1 ABC transporter permease [Actinocatenispora rupis]
MRAADVRPKWMEPPTRIGLAAKVLALAAIAVLVLYPFVAVLSTSLSSEAEISRHGGLVLFPTSPTLDAYRVIFAGGVVTSALVRSILITAVGTACSLAATVGMAYGLSRRGVVGGRFFLLVALFTMLFSPGVIPNFLVVKQLGLLDTYAALVLPTLISAFNLVVLRSFFMNLPTELYEAARIDGAGDFRVLLRIVLPLSKSVLAVVALFYAVGYWNAFFNAMLYVNDDKWPLAMVLRQFVLQGQSLNDTVSSSETSVPAQAIQMAVVVVSLVPILVVYPFLQRYFTKGVLTGAVKG